MFMWSEVLLCGGHVPPAAQDHPQDIQVEGAGDPLPDEPDDEEAQGEKTEDKRGPADTRGLDLA